VTALVFFLLGIPAAFLADRAIAHLSRPGDELEDEALAAKRLPWQIGPWPARVRVGVVLFIPLLMAVAGSRFDIAPAIAVSALIIGLLVCTATDLLRYRVPNAVTYPGTALALLACVLLPGAGVLNALLAALLGGGLFFVLAIATRGGLGLGDVKLAVLIGAALGLPAGYQALFIGMFAAGVFFLALLAAGIVSRRQAVPYAPFLALTAVAFVLVDGAAYAPL
jgi:leader peptidase (prepilin peptidase)/N-methyltransferase